MKLKPHISMLILQYVVVLLSLIGCNKSDEKKSTPIFFKVPFEETQIDFENTLRETDDFNIIEYLYFYNGGGVATGDINNDGLTDIYFTSNQGSNKLYINKGRFQFEDITEKAGARGIGNWKTGVTMADVNGDGLLDIFVCGVGNYKKFKGRNQLLINNGNLTFTDRTKDFGLDFQGFSTQASFFDYDNDGDLDMYLLNHSVHSIRSYGDVSLRFQSDPLAGDKLYRNNLIPDGSDKFTEVTSDAGIYNSQIGFGLSVGISDLNNDGYQDIYIGNDFRENDYLYINQRNGTFKQELERSIPHSTRFTMGGDIADFNNDGWSDILTLDMQPRDETVIKTTAGEDSYDIYEFKLRFGYHYQFSRNALQLNRGVDREGKLMFSDIAALAGIEATDWSWSALFADFDNDGLKDLFISNGISRRPNDMDYINYISSDSAQQYFSDAQFVEKMPPGAIPDYFFRNKGDLTFEKMNGKWYDFSADLSNGVSYADLDNDGDLDLIVNHINDKASIYRNDISRDSLGYLMVKLNGEKKNTSGVGAKVIAYTNGQSSYHEQMPSRGWLSSVDHILHIGLGKYKKADSLVVIWPDGLYQLLKSVNGNQLVTLNQRDAKNKSYFNKSEKEQSAIVKEVKGIKYRHKENYYVGFNIERLMPHMVSAEGPKLAIGDINNDQLDDVFICGAKGQAGALFIQNTSGTFSELAQQALDADSLAEDTDAVFFDADSDGDRDLVVASGGQEYDHKSVFLQPRIYLNDGKGDFKKSLTAFPRISVNASCVRPVDVDLDGDIDIFIGGRVITGKYGIDPPSYLLLNDGKGKFSDRTAMLFAEDNDAQTLGMVTDGLWHDLNKDSKPDLIVVGEWMPVTVLIQDASGKFENKTIEYGLNDSFGLWNTISAADYDRDGDLDFIAGNLGLNSRLKASANEPVELFIGDLDRNGGYEQFLTYYNGGIRYPFISRDQLVKQVPALKRKFLKYEDFKNVTLEDIIPKRDFSDFVKKKATMLSSAYFENTGDGKFVIKLLPLEAQVFPLHAICFSDLNSDGNLDVLAGGNRYNIQPEFSRYDAGYGLIMLGDGTGSFTSLSPQESGFMVTGEVRDIDSLTSQGSVLYLIARNNQPLMIYCRPQADHQP